MDPLVSKNNRTHSVFQQRYLVAILGFLTSVLTNAFRVNLSIAIVAMTNSTHADDIQELANDTTECPSNIYNLTEATSSGGEFSWSPELQGYILSASFFGNLVIQIPGGILARKYGAKKVFVGGITVTSISSLLVPLAARFHPYMLLFLSLMTGFGLGVTPTASAVLMIKWFPKSERGILSSIFLCGIPAGAFIAGVTSGLLCDLEVMGGWPLVFYVSGSFGVFVAILFLVFFFEEPENDPRISKEELKHIKDLQTKEMMHYSTNAAVPWFTMLTSMPTVAFIVAFFGIQWMNLYLVSVHTLYLGKVLHLPIRQNGFLTGGPFALATGLMLLVSLLSYCINQHTKFKINTIRKTFNCLGCIVFSVGLIGVYFSGCNVALNKLFLYLAVGSTSFNYVGGFINSMDITPTYCAPLLGITNTLGCFAGFLVPLMAGKLTNEGQNLTQWGKIFLITTGIALFCGLIFHFFGSAEVQPWDPAYAKRKQKDLKDQETELSDKDQNEL